MSLMEHLIRVDPFDSSNFEKSKALCIALEKLALEDKHDIFVPTDVIMKNGEPVGCFRVQTIPIVAGYLATKKMFPRDSVAAFNIMEQVIRRTTGADRMVVPINKNSPFHSNMVALGYVEEANHTYFYKNFNL